VTGGRCAVHPAATVNRISGARRRFIGSFLDVSATGIGPGHAGVRTREV
jgi:hypothetical protein